VRYVVTPSFGEKATRLGSSLLGSIGKIIKIIEGSNRQELDQYIEPLFEENIEIYVWRADEFQIYLSFSADKEGAYVLLVDLVIHGSAPFKPLASRDPSLNHTVDPRRNMMIDPNRNMAIDPNRNMMVDPRRNMMIDPNRNMMIDPRRNSLIDPQRNWLIDPRRNTTWDGPYVYDLSGHIDGFLVRASDEVAILFDRDAKFSGTLVAAGENFNQFDQSGKWTHFLVPNGGDGYNRFDLRGKWDGFVVGNTLVNARHG
jgi:hypothetical protein